MSSRLVPASLTGLASLIAAEYKSFKDLVLIEKNRIRTRNIPEAPGVYIIFEETKPIYVGSSGNLRNIIHNLFYYNRRKYKIDKESRDPFNHTLTYKLTKRRFRDPEKVRSFYLNQCRLKFVETENDEEAKELKSFLISLLNPEYNEKRR